MAGEIAFDYDDLTQGSSRALRSRLLWIAALAVLLGAVATGIWWEFMRGGATAATAVQTATVSMGNVTKTVSTSGTVAAQSTSNLNFGTAGRITKVNVALGQQVKQGDVLAEIDSSDAQSALASANLSLATAQSKLDQLLQGSAVSALAAADQSQQQAQANYDKAVRAQQDLLKPADAVAIESSQQGVTTAQAQLQQAKDARAKLDSDEADNVKAANSGVDKAQNNLDTAEQSQTNAEGAISTAQASLFSAETAYCALDSSVSFCPNHAAPISSGDQGVLVGKTSSGTPDEAKAASSVLAADTGYAKSLTDKQTADNAVTAAESALSDANDAVDKAQAGPTAGQIATADAAIGSAQAQVDTAQDKLTKLQAGPTNDDLAAAQNDVDSAAASLTSAQAKRDEAYAGPVATDVAQQRQSVSQAQNAVDKAQKDVGNTKLAAPFDGTVAALNNQVGDLASTGTSSNAATIILNTPDNVVLNLSISETDYGSVKAGQAGTATFDAITGAVFPIVIDSIGTNPTTTQGVVNYSARAHFVAGPPAGLGAGASVPGSPPSGGIGAGGQNGGRRTAATQTAEAGGASSTPQAGATPSGTPGAGGAQRRGSFGAGVSAPTTTQKPAPGMNAKITIITDSRQNVLRVPNAAVTRDGQNRVLEVKESDGTTRKVTVEVGLSDTTNTEITSGVDEGATVILPGVVATTSAAPGTGAATGTGAGGGFFGGGGGAGGGAAGGGGGRGGGN